MNPCQSPPAPATIAGASPLMEIEMMVIDSTLNVRGALAFPIANLPRTDHRLWLEPGIILDDAPDLHSARVDVPFYLRLNLDGSICDRDDPEPAIVLPWSAFARIDGDAYVVYGATFRRPD